jgi:hypothetical protein
MVSLERASREWYEEAARCYMENHQGCAWCGGAHRVFKRQQDSGVEYFCNGCDFRAGFNPDTQSYFTVAGEVKPGRTRDTMYEM